MKNQIINELEPYLKEYFDLIPEIDQLTQRQDDIDRQIEIAQEQMEDTKEHQKEKIDDKVRKKR